jgi:transposase-like protein
LKAVHTQVPRVITVDKNAAYSKTINELKADKELPKKVKLRQKKYLNNIVELSASRDKTISQTWHGIRLV